jgi:hypothetical protein
LSKIFKYFFAPLSNIVDMEYKALDPKKGEIRLLEILQQDRSPIPPTNLIGIQPDASSALSTSSAGRSQLDSDSVYCKLDHFSLEAYSRNMSDATGANNDCLSERYIALSYMWGSHDKLDVIHMNDYDQLVRHNLKKALEALQKTEYVKAGCKIWCDALCIDQESIPERNREVKRMGDIYRNALRVALWLGDAANGSDEVIDFINGVYEARTNGIEAVSQYIRCVFAAQGIALWDRMSKFITRPYFFRLWIIQEMVMGGNREMLLLCGSKTTTWARLHLTYHNFDIFGKQQARDQELTTAVRLELENADPAIYDAYHVVQFWMWQKCEDLRILQDLQMKGENKVNRNLLDRCRVALCSSPLDKVYGIRSLLSQAMADKIIPDYNSDVSQAYMDFTRAWVESEGTLEALTEAGSSGENYKRDRTIPSLAIDLQQETKQKVCNKYNADGQIKAQFSFIRHGKVLSAKGIIFDMVDGTSGLFENIHRTIRYSEEDCGDVTDIQNSAVNTNAYGEKISEALWRSLVGDRDRLGNLATPSYSCLLDSSILDCRHGPSLHGHRTSMESLLGNLHLWIRRNADFVLRPKKPLKHFLRDVKVLDNQLELYQDCVARMSEFMWYRRLITTERGYIGNAPRPVRRGDVVGVLFGCCAPLILRPDPDVDGDCFEIVAECYLQGIMDGEIVRGIQEGTYEVQDILIS